MRALEQLAEALDGFAIAGGDGICFGVELTGAHTKGAREATGAGHESAALLGRRIQKILTGHTPIVRRNGAIAGANLVRP